MLKFFIGSEEFKLAQTIDLGIKDFNLSNDEKYLIIFSGNIDKGADGKGPVKEVNTI
jgi:hypothetical protein